MNLGSTFTSSLLVLTTNSLDQGMRRRRFMQGLGAAAISTSAVGIASASGPEIPSYVTLSSPENEELLDAFKREEVDENSRSSWAWTLTRFTHGEKADDCSEELGLNVPPYGIYVFHLDAGRDLGIEKATEKEGTCVSAGFEYKIGWLRTDCLTRIDSIGTEPEITEVGAKGKTLFQDQFEEDLPISSGEWEFGLKDSGLIRDPGWEYTQSDSTVYDKRTFTAVIDSKDVEEMHDPVSGRNDLDVRCFFTTEKSSETGNYLVIVGVVPDDDEVYTGFSRRNAVDFKPGAYRNNIRTLMKAVSA